MSNTKLTWGPSTASGYSVTQGLRRAVQRAGGNVATRMGDRTHTYRELQDRVCRFAYSLRTNGLSEGGPVAILALNSDRYLEFYYSVSWAGGLVVPMNIRLSPEEILYSLADCQSEVVLIDDAFKPFLPALQAKAPFIKHLVYIGDGETPEPCKNYEQWVKDGQVCDACPRNGDDTYGIFYTGGTTGSPKGVELTHTNIMFNAMAVICALKYDASTIYGHFAPMFHLADGASTFAVTLACGTHTFIPKFEPEASCKAVVDNKVTAALLVPTMMGMMVNHPNVAKYDCSSLRIVLYGASPMPEAVLLQAMKVFPNSGFVQGYGMTETSPVNTFLLQEHHFEGNPRLRSVGTACEHAEIKIFDENDKELPIGSVGELVVRGPHVMKGYFNKPDQTEAVLKNGWMHTGDGARQDEDGFFYICDRIKDMVISGGENVYSAEVENVVMAHPSVGQCAVIGIPDEALVEKVAAIVVLKEGQSLAEDELYKHCKEKIAGYKCPRKLIIRDEPLPLSGAGKVLKHKLRAPFWEGQERQVYQSTERESSYQ